MYEYEARNGYRYLALGKLTKHQSYIELFYSLYEGVNLLLKLAAQFSVDRRFCHYGTSDKEKDVNHDNPGLPDKECHNDAVNRALEFLEASRPSYAIVDRGRTVGERSCIWVEKGHFYGMGYIAPDVTITDVSEIKEYLTPYKGNAYITQLIVGYATKFPARVLKPSATTIQEYDYDTF